MPRRLRMLTAPPFLALAALALAGCGLGGPAHEAPSPEAAATVDMGFSSFTPETVTIRVGQSVEWRNTSVITHSVTDDPRLAKTAGDASVPPGATTFNSSDIPAGHVFLYKFTQLGTYRYFCTHHEGDNMVGKVVVTPAS